MSWGTITTQSKFTDITSGISLSSLPHLLWQYYLEYLWFYKPGSWVARIAYTFRVLAFAFIMPMVFITLLDVTSYVIARTLGVVDDVKASTSDVSTIHTVIETDSIPSIILTTSSPTVPPDLTPRVPTEEAHSEHEKEEEEIAKPVPHHASPQTFFASEDMQLKLSGEGLFSPAASIPSSPTLTRRHIANLDRTPYDD